MKAVALRYADWFAHITGVPYVLAWGRDQKALQSVAPGGNLNELGRRLDAFFESYLAGEGGFQTVDLRYALSCLNSKPVLARLGAETKAKPAHAGPRCDAQGRTQKNIFNTQTEEA